MNLIILSAADNDHKLLNKHRHELLVNALQAEGYTTYEGIGVADGTKEDIVVLQLESLPTCDEHDFFDTLAFSKKSCSSQAGRLRREEQKRRNLLTIVSRKDQK